MNAPRVLVTGPTRALADYADAARNAGWEAIEKALLEIVPKGFDWAPDFDGLPDVSMITSQSAIDALDELARSVDGLRTVPVAVVGEKTAERVSQLGFEVAGRAADGATSLASRYASENAAKIFWPRGSLSTQLADDLRANGHSVWDPIAYETVRVEITETLPDAHAVFFASPSAVRAWRDAPRARDVANTIAVAIGTSTAEEIEQEKAERFFDILSLPHPAPEALTWRLENLGYEPPGPR